MENGLCGVHIELNAIDHNKGKLVDKNFVDEAKADIKMLRNDVGSHKLFVTMGEMVLSNWREHGEVSFANTMSKEYFKTPYNKWSCNSNICIQDENGIYDTIDDCNKNCINVKPKSVSKYFYSH